MQNGHSNDMSGRNVNVRRVDELQLLNHNTRESRKKAFTNNFTDFVKGKWSQMVERNEELRLNRSRG